MLTVHALTFLTRSLSAPVHKVAWPGIYLPNIYNIFIPPNHPLFRIACQTLAFDMDGMALQAFLFHIYSAVCSDGFFS